MTAVQHRAFIWDDDIAPITHFLLESYTHYRRMFNWDPRRWLGTVYHNNDADMTRHRDTLPQHLRIWQDARGAIVGVVIPEYTGQVFLHIHPAYRQIEAEMLAWAEDSLPWGRDADGHACLYVWAEADDTQRSALLTQRGYTRQDVYETMYRRPMDQPVPSILLPPGYQVRGMRVHPDDQRGLAALLNAAFKRDFHSAEEYHNFQTKNPHYAADLDIVVEAPDGTLAANAGFTAHNAQSFAVVEPVCTHPDHQGHGLARAAIAEGLRRVQAQGIEAAFVGAFYNNAVANHVYQAMGFTDGVRLYQWRLNKRTADRG